VQQFQFKKMLQNKDSNIFKTFKLTNKTNLFIFLLALPLITIPLPPFYNSIATILFLLYAFSRFYKLKFKINKALLLPIILFGLMTLSLLWTSDVAFSLKGLQKNSPFLLIPLAFLFFPKFDKKTLYSAIRLFGFSMVVFAIYSFIRATIRYVENGDKSMFLYNELVSVELNAIYIATFTTLALFYFIVQKSKKTLDYIAIYILALFVALLYSKTVFLMVALLLVWHYIQFSKTQTSVKWVTIALGVTFLFLSAIFVPVVQERVSEEYETAFVDNTIYADYGNKDQNIYNISLKQAYTKKEFEPNSFFPGTAYRVFQARIFTELLQEKSILFTGLGINASDEAIQDKHKQYNLFKDYEYHNFHNQYIQFFAELGILGFVIFVLMVFINLKNAIKNKNFLHIVFAVSMIILFLTESLLCRQRGILFFITLYCIFNSIPNKTKEIKSK
jgi:hypothetical protein